MKLLDVITIGSAVRDITFFTNQGKFIATPQNLTEQRMLAFEYGAKINIDEAYVTFGGGATNAAVSLARLGAHTAACCRVGSDQAAHDIKENLHREKVVTTLLQEDVRTLSGFSMILATDKKDREHIAFVHRGANNSFQITQSMAERLRSSWFYISGLTGPHWLTSLRALFASAKKSGTKIFWNPGAVQLQAGKRILQPLLEHTDILIMNKDEAIELALSGVRLGRKNPNHLNRPVYLLHILQEWGPKSVVITDGEHGAWGYDGHKIHHQKIIKVKTINTTGVGDAFGSAFLASLISNPGNMQQAFNWGMVNSASVVTKMGAQHGLLTRRQILERNFNT